MLPTVTVCRYLIRVASLLAPIRLRDSWLQQWDAELWHGHRQMLVRGIRAKEAHGKLLRFSFGAFTDAADLLRRSFDLQSALGHPALCIMAPLTFIALVAGLTEGFQSTRQIVSEASSHRPEQLMLLSRSARVFGMEAAPSLADLTAWQRQSTHTSLAGFVLDGHRLYVTDNFFEVLGEPRHTPFVFLGRTVDKVEALGSRPVRIGVLARRDARIGIQEVAAELPSPNGSTVTAITLDSRQHQVLLVPMAVAVLMLAFGMIQARGGRGGLFLFASTTLAQCAVAITWSEQVGRFASSSTGGVSFGASVPGIGLNLMAAGVALAWSLYDYKERCPVCLRRLAMPVRIGVSSSAIFEAAGVETLCPAGHGSRFVPDWTGLAVEKLKWTSFDASWRDGFVRGGLQ